MNLSTAKKPLLVALAFILVGASGYWYGRHASPEKVVTVVDETTKKKLDEVAYEKKVLERDFEALRLEKSKVVVETKVIHDKVVTADVNTKCDERFSPKTGKLVRRICERIKQTTTVEHDEALASVRAEKETLERTVESLRSENEALKKKTEETVTVRREETTKTFSTKDNLLIGVGAGLTLGSETPTYNAQVGYRLFGPFWVGAQASTAKTLTLNILMTLP